MLLSLWAVSMVLSNNIYIEGAGLLPKQIWNIDEFGFPTDSIKAKVITPKGKVANKLAYGAGKKNLTTLIVSSTAGWVLDPLRIFWKKGLMIKEFLHSWFEKFCQ